jgi:threonyl-tRNA synthetase
MSEENQKKISVFLPDGSASELNDGSSALDLASKISEGLARNSVASEINGEIKDISAKLNEGDKVRILTSRDAESLAILRHSTAHIMAKAVQNLFPQAKIAIGPNIENGFYYDFDISDHALTNEDLPLIEEEMKKIISEGQIFERFELEDNLKQLELFKTKGEIYKAELLSELKDEKASVYITKGKEECEGWNDLCRGPHIPSTKFIKAFKLLSVAGAYWRGDEKNKMLQRIYATAFWTKEDLKEYLDKLEEAEKRDHRKLSAQLDLFSIREEVGSGLVLWHPNLGVVRQMLEDYWRTEHRRRGYDIVYSPHIAKSQLWDISGHNEHFRENMFYMQIDEQDYVLKPMNCPFHILIYQAKRYSYRSLPLRLAELGTVYRYERSGTLHGLTRVRGFTQDDSHIFCTQDQFIPEIKDIIDFIDYTLKLFGMTYTVELSTRPEGYAGTIEVWDKAEAGLKQALEEKQLEYRVNEGDGAFYGPKIDFKLKDAIGRTWQGATIQLDFNLPVRFDIKYTEKDGSLATPVMIHRVIFGTMERFIGVLIEHYAGAFPSWLAPEQVTVIPIADRHFDYAEEVYKKFKNLDIRAHLDDRSESLNYKIRDAQMRKAPYMLIIGDKEKETGSVSIRSRVKGDLGVKPTNEFVESLKQEIDGKLNTSIF